MYSEHDSRLGFRGTRHDHAELSHARAPRAVHRGSSAWPRAVRYCHRIYIVLLSSCAHGRCFVAVPCQVPGSVARAAPCRWRSGSTFVDVASPLSPLTRDFTSLARTRLTQSPPATSPSGARLPSRAARCAGRPAGALSCPAALATRDLDVLRTCAHALSCQRVFAHPLRLIDFLLSWFSRRRPSRPGFCFIKTNTEQSRKGFDPRPSPVVFLFWRRWQCAQRRLRIRVCASARKTET